MAHLVTPDQGEFAAHMCSRLCHDLISPVGAIANGLEILSEETDPDMRAQVIDLLSQSVQVTTAKLRFFRMAFGAPGGLGGTMDAREVEAAVQDFMEAGKTRLVWGITSGSLPKVHIKFLLIAAMIAADSLVRGGEVSLSGDPESGYTLSATGPKVVIDREIKTILTAGANQNHMVSRYAPYVLMMSVLQEAGVGLTLNLDAASLSLALQV